MAVNAAKRQTPPCQCYAHFPVEETEAQEWALDSILAGMGTAAEGPRRAFKTSGS